MSRPLAELDATDRGDRREPHLSRSTARAFAAAITALLISTLVVNRTSEALSIEGTVAANTFESGTITLVDDDGGRSLFDLSDMAPGRPTDRCIEVVYQGSIVPVALRLTTEAAGELAPYLTLTLEEGRGGGFETCDGFEPTEPLFQGSLDELASIRTIELGRIHNVGDSRSFRFRFDLADRREALGRVASADFVWEVTPA